MRQLFTRDQITQKLTTIGHRTAFNNDQNPYHIVRYNRPRNDKCKPIQTRKLTAKSRKSPYDQKGQVIKGCQNLDKYIWNCDTGTLMDIDLTYLKYVLNEILIGINALLKFACVFVL